MSGSYCDFSISGSDVLRGEKKSFQNKPIQTSLSIMINQNFFFSCKTTFELNQRIILEVFKNTFFPPSIKQILTCLKLAAHNEKFGFCLLDSIWSFGIFKGFSFLLSLLQQ